MTADVSSDYAEVSPVHFGPLRRLPASWGLIGAAVAPLGMAMIMFGTQRA